ncbi:MAG TPA: T9SS type A sorting domain-containing protein, partial [Saprospiraceae bacterium]|nr:hypothetical protein [Saprospirales bacterium]HRQ29494.1 T9SS type A sorting domain-containing protein [Saprospiraceae bacterium]
MKKVFFTGLVLLIFSGFGLSQELILMEKIRTFTKSELSSIFFIEALYNVDVYRIHYTTTNTFAQKDTASGVFCLPVKANTVFPILIYDHGTVSDRYDVPSFGSYEQSISAVFASFGFITVAPDYIGLGISKGLHPYVHPESEARAGIDLVLAVKAINSLENFHYNDQLFITGYSQGGHAAMATFKTLSASSELEVTAVAPMSGPYSISREMKKFTFGDTEYFFCAYLGSVLLTAKYVYPELFTELEIEDMLKPDYAVMVRKFEREEIDLDDLNDQMIAKLRQNNGKVLPKRMFIDSVANAFLTDDDHPLNQALERMDVCDWKPEKPLKMLYCKNDDQVTYRNAVYADSLMHANGSETVSAADVFSSGDHGTCFYPAALALRTFFWQYQEIGTVGTTEPENPSISIWPNPASDLLYFENINMNVQGKDIMIRLYDATGQLLATHKILPNAQAINNIDIHYLKSGLYIIEISNSNGLVEIKKLVKSPQ